MKFASMLKYPAEAAEFKRAVEAAVDWQGYVENIINQINAKAETIATAKLHKCD